MQVNGHLKADGQILQITISGNMNTNIYGVKTFMSLTEAEQILSKAGRTKASSSDLAVSYKDASGNVLVLTTDHGLVSMLTLTYGTYNDMLNS